MAGRHGRYFIGTASRLAQMHPTSLRKYERAGFLEPARTGGNVRLYSDADVRRSRQIKRLVEDWGVNMTGVERVLAISDKVQELREVLAAEELSEGGRAGMSSLMAELLVLLGRDPADESRSVSEKQTLQLAH